MNWADVPPCQTLTFYLFYTWRKQVGGRKVNSEEPRGRLSSSHYSSKGSPYVFKIWGKPRYCHLKCGVLKSQYICFHFIPPQPTKLGEHVRKKSMGLNWNSNIFLDNQTLKSKLAVFLSDLRSFPPPSYCCGLYSLPGRVWWRDKTSTICSSPSACHAKMNAGAAASRWYPKHQRDRFSSTV